MDATRSASLAGERMTVKHPAKFSSEILDAIEGLVTWTEYEKVLDPFAGTGLIHTLRESYGCQTVGVEIEPEWATLHPKTLVGNALQLPFRDDAFDAIVTSPCYGNRMADSHTAKDSSRRITYTHTLGRKLHPKNSGSMQWGDKYRAFHVQAWDEALRVLRPGGVFVLNISDHVREGRVMRVSDFHVNALMMAGLSLRSARSTPTRRMKFGENYEARVESELVAVLSKPEK